MTPENFCYWLQGYIELSNCKSLSPEQTQMIRDHLNLVFKKETKINTSAGIPTYPLKQTWGVFREDATSVLCTQDPTITPSC
jgi:hypothetical protein